MHRLPKNVCVALIVGLVAAGCTARAPDPELPPAETNACSSLPAPLVDRSAPATFRGTNAYAYMVGLVCDHSGPAPQERARVPGTANHTAGAAYLHGQLRANGVDARFQNFTGSQYEGIMTDPAHASSSYKFWYSTCRAEDRQRLRGLHFSNVEARFGPSAGPLVILMAHWDSKRYASDGKTPVLGANDGASGVGVLLEAARLAPAKAWPWDLRILLTDGEDGFDDCHPLAGATFYAEQFAKSPERARLRGILLLDMVGDLDATFYQGCGRDTKLSDRIWSIAARLDVRQFKAQGGCHTTDDHTAFEERGMNAVDVIDFDGAFPPYWHTDGDTPDKLSPDMLGNVGRVVVTLLDELPLAAA